MMITKSDALYSLGFNGGWTIKNGIITKWFLNQPQPTEEEIQAKIAELTAAEPLRQLRIERNQLLTQTDWRMTTDYPYSDQTAWATYRTSLRDLPATASPTLDENGNLTNVVWPTAPSEV